MYASISYTCNRIFMNHYHTLLKFGTMDCVTLDRASLSSDCAFCQYFRSWLFSSCTVDEETVILKIEFCRHS